VIHAGDSLIVDGVRGALQGHESRYIYEAGEPLEIDLEHPLPAGEAALLMRWAHHLEWEQGAIDGTLLAGWVVCALASGALEWRPHAFLCGKSGSGKSTAAQVVQAILGPCCLRAKSQETTGSGIRQHLGADVLPVVYDEAEALSPEGRRRIDEVLSLMRASSSDGDGQVLKGSQSGSGVAYALRSAFLLIAIRVPMKQTADESRITVLRLRKPGPADQKAAARHFKSTVQPLALQLSHPDWGARFRARVFLHLAELRANATVFGAAAALHLGSARLGDQLGPLLAGAYLLHRDGLVSAAAAAAWVARQPWRDQIQVVDSGDDDKLLATLLESRVRVVAERYTYDASVAELIGYASKRVYNKAIDHETARAELGRRGLAVRGGYLCVSNTHIGVGELLRGSAYEVGWDGVLRGKEGHVIRPPERYAGALSRGIGIPLDTVLGLLDQPVSDAGPVVEEPPWDG
jgi:putative DNA primase/helicase